ncbi:hypothetical protein [Streptomyces sp. NPDC002589]|uniref:hypothetical protein n=1 Tax=unclassified Streptomyces TaxID=2593676 RepID=UPI00331735B5
MGLWQVLGLRGGARVDFIVTETDDVHALEVNTTPGLSRDSNFADAARLCGLRRSDVILALLHEATHRRPYDVPLPRPVLKAA